MRAGAGGAGGAVGRVMREFSALPARPFPGAPGLTAARTGSKLRQMPNRTPQLDRVFRALADPTRRAVLEQLGRGPAAMSDLHRPFTMALPSFSQHLDVLETCGLVRSRKIGRVRTYRLVPKPLEQVEHWMTRHRSIWERRLDRLDHFLTTLQEPAP